MTENQIGCVGTTIKTRSGIYFDLLNPNPSDVLITDIAFALSNTCRFGGHCTFYSVAEHCTIAARRAYLDGRSKEICLAILLHDASESVAGDIVKPLKNLIREAYEPIEERIQSAIGQRFGIDFKKHHDIIKKYDLEMLMVEKRALFSRSENEPKWAGEDLIEKIDVIIKMLPPSQAYQEFMNAFNVLSDIPF